MRVRWSRQSSEHLVALRGYIREHNPDAAERVRLRIIETVRLLGTLPRLGHTGRKQGTREFVVPHLPYIIVYRVDIADDDELVILGIFHGAQHRRHFLCLAHTVESGVGCPRTRTVLWRDLTP